jgi:DNA-binding transcriptional MerR regulator
LPQQIPEKAHYKLGEVCEIADTQPYVLRFWETEFPQLNPRKSRTGHPIYTRDDVDLILRIKRLLHEEEFTLADARERLDSGPDDPAPGQEPPGPDPADAPASIAAAVNPANVQDLESELDVTRRRLSELRDRYDAAVDEIRRLKERLDAVSALEDERDTLRREAEALRERVAELERAETASKGRKAAEAKAAVERDRLAARTKTLEDEVQRLGSLLREAVDLLRDLEGSSAKA